jgi:putative copper export protein
MTYRLVVILHVLAATVWTGGHLILALTVLPRALRARDPRIVQEFESGFERLGIPALFVQIATGLWLAWRIAPNAAAWFSFDNAITAHIGIKLLLLLATILLAMHARLRLIPRLSAATLPALAAHIAAVTVLSVLFVLVGVGLRTGGLF